MKRFISVILSILMIIGSALAVVGCSRAEEASFELVYITDGGALEDGAYNESAWNGVKQFGDENNMNYRYYQPNTDENGELDSNVVNDYINLAVENGARYIVMQGEKMAVVLNEYAVQYPDTGFLLLGANLHSADSEHATTIPNVMTVSFDTVQAGFLAGYTSIALGYTKLGYFGSLADKESSSSYGIGYANGSAYGADEKGIPTILEYVNCDDERIDYSVTVRPVYQKIEDCKEKVFRVNVVGGIGSGVYTNGENVTISAQPAEEGKAFDHWEVKSDTEGVKDNKVNINTNKDSSINLLVGDCDCTIVAVWRDADTVKIIVEGNEEVVNAEKNTSAWIQAPPAKRGMTFDHWESEDASIIKDVNSAATEIAVGEKDVVLTPVYAKSDAPTYDVKVENGTGSGSYKKGDKATVVAEAPQDGYMFYKWENVDSNGLNGGLPMTNEYCYITEFEMSDRYTSVVEAMFDEGIQVVFGGGNSQEASAFNATNSISHQVYCFGWGTDQGNKGNCLASVVCDYRVAVLNTLKDFKGGTNFVGNCSNNCLYVTNISNNPDDKKYNEGYASLYKSLADETLIVPNEINTDSKCLTIKYWVK